MEDARSSADLVARNACMTALDSAKVDVQKSISLNPTKSLHPPLSKTLVVAVVLHTADLRPAFPFGLPHLIAAEGLVSSRCG